MKMDGCSCSCNSQLVNPVQSSPVCSFGGRSGGLPGRAMREISETSWHQVHRAAVRPGVTFMTHVAVAVACTCGPLSFDIDN